LRFLRLNLQYLSKGASSISSNAINELDTEFHSKVVVTARVDEIIEGFRRPFLRISALIWQLDPLQMFLFPLLLQAPAILTGPKAPLPGVAIMAPTYTTI
jgi:hypothetical protein